MGNAKKLCKKFRYEAREDIVMQESSHSSEDQRTACKAVPALVSRCAQCNRRKLGMRPVKGELLVRGLVIGFEEVPVAVVRVYRVAKFCQAVPVD